MPLTPGTKLGPYEIVAQLGAGGMGEVYRARDTRLDRTVAIKVLPGSLANDPDRLSRFEGEARVLSTLNHPNLLAIFDVGKGDVGTQDGLHYLVSEFLEGETLRERLALGALSQRKASEYGLQLANGLAAAHEKGIVHRDLKPENIFVTPGDHVKILDFGLAKQAPGIKPGDNSVTMTSAGGGGSNTAPGTVMGTVGYMSPEQVRGQTLDYRSDIFSFGAILYEMVAGRRAFKGDSGVETMNAILKEEPPDLDAAQLKVSPGMERIIRHCLEKNPANRFQSARDLGFALSSLSGSTSDSQSAQSAALSSQALLASDESQIPPPRGAKFLPWIAALVFGLLGAGITYFGLKSSSPAPAHMQFAIPIDWEVNHLAITPDGTVLALVMTDPNTGENQLGVKRVGSPDVTMLAGTDDAQYPFFSPDGAWIGFFASGNLKKIPVGGGAAQTLAVTPNPRGGAWGANNLILYAPDSSTPLYRINADGSGGRVESAQSSSGKSVNSHRWPSFLPDGVHYVYFSGNFTNSADDKLSGLYLSSTANPTERRELVVARSTAQYSNGYLYYVDLHIALVALPMDAKSGAVTGEPQAVAPLVGYHPANYYAAFVVSKSGTLVYNTSDGATLSQLTWFDRSGKEIGRVGEKGVIANPQLSPDGTKVAVDISDKKANNVDVWLYGLKDSTATRFTFDPAEEVGAAWSHSGDRIAFRSAANTGIVVVKKTRGFEPPAIAHDNLDDDVIPNCWSLDDSTIVGATQKVDSSSSLMLIDAATGKSTEILTTKGGLTNGQISPDGKWIAYASNESGDWEVYVTSYPAAQGKWQVSRGTGEEPRWRGDGKEMFYIGPERTLTAVPITLGDTVSVGTPVALFPIVNRQQISSTDLFSYDVTKDGQRFIVNRYLKPDHVDPLTIVLHSTTTP